MQLPPPDPDDFWPLVRTLVILLAMLVVVVVAWWAMGK